MRLDNCVSHAVIENMKQRQNTLRWEEQIKAQSQTRNALKASGDSTLGAKR
jgi:hypothetical protein